MELLSYREDSAWRPLLMIAGFTTVIVGSAFMYRMRSIRGPLPRPAFSGARPLVSVSVLVVGLFAIGAADLLRAVVRWVMR